MVGDNLTGDDLVGRRSRDAVPRLHSHGQHSDCEIEARMPALEAGAAWEGRQGNNSLVTALCLSRRLQSSLPPVSRLSRGSPILQREHTGGSLPYLSTMHTFPMLPGFLSSSPARWLSSQTYMLIAI